MDISKPKKIRGSNFNKEEELFLLQEIDKVKHIIECKTSNRIVNSKKEQAWRKILSNFNAKNPEFRTMLQLRSKFDNLKTKARKELAEQKLPSRRSGGGGAASKDVLDPVTEATLKIINTKEVLGFWDTSEGDFDASSLVVKEEPRQDHPSLVNELGEAEDEISETSMQSTSTQADPLEIALFGHSSRESTKNLCLCPNNLNGATNKLRANSISTVDPLCTEKEEYYKKKRELLEKTAECEEMDRVKRRKREEEEHSKKMILLDLEIRLKEKELNKQSV